METKKSPFRVEYRELIEEEKIDIRAIKTSADVLYKLIEDVVPDSRERSLALTNLEQAVMWAVKGVTA